MEAGETIGAAIIPVLYCLLQATAVHPVLVAYTVSTLAVPLMYLKALRVLVGNIGRIGAYAAGLNVSGHQGLRLIYYQLGYRGCDRDTGAHAQY